jgi:hypothetical protein
MEGEFFDWKFSVQCPRMNLGVLIYKKLSNRMVLKGKNKGA